MSPEDEIVHHEDAFIQSFIWEVRRERLRHELKNDRLRFINRFCHNATEFLNPAISSSFRRRTPARKISANCFWTKELPSDATPWPLTRTSKESWWIWKLHSKHP